ncbi:MAG TPA: hypothetical protein VN755_03905, partial [Steroidobacteraceae bacterium]|nr:hypothetical protein [Steroidobacteraceae bacterium]
MKRAVDQTRFAPGRIEQEQSDKSTQGKVMTGGIRLGLVSAAVLASLSGVTQAAEDAGEIEEVTVTGSRIRGVAPVGSPVIALGRDDLNLSASSTVADFLKEIPQVVGTGIDETRFVSTGINASNASRATAINL